MNVHGTVHGNTLRLDPPVQGVETVSVVSPFFEIKDGDIVNAEHNCMTGQWVSVGKSCPMEGDDP